MCNVLWKQIRTSILPLVTQSCHTYMHQIYTTEFTCFYGLSYFIKNIFSSHSTLFSIQKFNRIYTKCCKVYLDLTYYIHFENFKATEFQSN